MTESCEARIKEQYEKRCELLAEIIAKADEDYSDFDLDEDSESYEDDLQSKLDDIPELYEFALGTSMNKQYKIQLSWGGPSDEIIVNADQHNNILSMEYRFLDWFDGASIPVHDDSYMWDYAQRMFELETEST